MPTAQQVPSVFNRIVNQNAEMFVKMLAAARTRNVYRSIMLLSVNAYQAMVVKLPIPLLDADHCQFHVAHLLIARPMLIVMVEFVNQPVHWTKSAH